MAGYYVEIIERITEQTIEQEIRNDIKEIVADVIGEDDDNNDGQVGKIKKQALDYIETQKNNLALTGDDLTEGAQSYEEQIKTINENIKEISEDAIAVAEKKIRQFIDKGYVLEIDCDEYGNADMILTKEVV